MNTRAKPAVAVKTAAPSKADAKTPNKKDKTDAETPNNTPDGDEWVEVVRCSKRNGTVMKAVPSMTGR